MLTQPKQHDMVKYMPRLTVSDITDAVKFIITRPYDINVSLGIIMMPSFFNRLHFRLLMLR